MKMAQQRLATKDAARALSLGKLVVESLGVTYPIVGLALGRGSRESFRPVNGVIPNCGHPIATVKIVGTTGRVPGVPCKIGFMDGAKYSRKWIISINREISFWRSQLNMPPIVDVMDGAVRVTSEDKAQQVKKDIYRELTGRSLSR